MLSERLNKLDNSPNCIDYINEKRKSFKDFLFSRSQIDRKSNLHRGYSEVINPSKRFITRTPLKPKLCLLLVLKRL